MGRYIHQVSGWPGFIWQQQAVSVLLTEVRHQQGRILGRMESLGFKLREEASLETLTLEVVKSSEIEGEILNPEEVRSSIARRLGLNVPGLVPSDRHVEGIVEVMLDATRNYSQPLTEERLFGWHAALFPTGRSGTQKIVVAGWRDNTNEDPMQIVSGPLGRQKVHYEAPASDRLPAEMEQFLKWFSEEEQIDPVIKAAIAHLWFVTIHPFEDGNGRIARAIADMQLSRADGTPHRFYSMSAQIRKERKEYYEILEATQKGPLDITLWLEWFLHCLSRTLAATSDTLAAVLKKAKFWETHSGSIFNQRQVLLINKLLDGFEGKLTSSKWAKITKCSQDTALRDIQGLVEKKILVQDPAGGRSTNYFLAEE